MCGVLYYDFRRFQTTKYKEIIRNHMYLPPDLISYSIKRGSKMFSSAAPKTCLFFGFRFSVFGFLDFLFFIFIFYFLFFHFLFFIFIFYFLFFIFLFFYFFIFYLFSLFFFPRLTFIYFFRFFYSHFFKQMYVHSDSLKP